MKNYFITAIGTDSGKTLVSAIIAEMLGTGYWKPVQAGYPRDTETVQSLVSNKDVTFYSEQYVLNTPASPHYAAEVDGVQLRAENLQIPREENLVVEGAGGLLVPINGKETMVDIIKHFRSEVVLVSNLYLGSINHTLLTVSELKRHEIPVKGIIFNGEPNAASEDIILAKSGYRCLLRIPNLSDVSPQIVMELSEALRQRWD